MIIPAKEIPDQVLAVPFKRAAYHCGLREEPQYRGVLYERRIANEFLGVHAAVAQAAYAHLCQDRTYNRFTALRNQELEGVVLNPGRLGELYLFLLGAQTPAQLRDDLDFTTSQEAFLCFRNLMEENFALARQWDAVPERTLLTQQPDEYLHCMIAGVQGHFAHRDLS